MVGVSWGLEGWVCWYSKPFSDSWYCGTCSIYCGTLSNIILGRFSEISCWITNTPVRHSLFFVHNLILNLVYIADESFIRPDIGVLLEFIVFLLRVYLFDDGPEMVPKMITTNNYTVRILHILLWNNQALFVSTWISILTIYILFNTSNISYFDIP